MCQSNPPEHGASTSDQSDSFQPEASFSFTVGRKQLDTRKTQVRWESWRQPTHDGPKDKIEHTYSSFCTHKAARWVIIAAKMNKNDMCKFRPLKGLLLMLRLCPCSRADPWSAGLILKRQAFLLSTAIASRLWGSYGAVWDFYFAPLLTGYRSVCLTSVSGSGEVFSVAGVEVEGLFAGSSLNGLSLAGEKRNSSGTSSSGWAFL